MMPRTESSWPQLSMVYFSHLGHQMVESAEQRGEKRVPLEETVRLREEITSILEHEKDERHNYFKDHLPDK